MPKMFSYVVQHDLGLAPNPEGGFCTMALCKFGSPAHRNILELATVGDWIIGTGGASSMSAGHGKLIYAMCVDEKMALRRFKHDSRFQNRRDAVRVKRMPRYRVALIAKKFVYYGRNAIPLGSIPHPEGGHGLEKSGPGFRRDFSVDYISKFVVWFDAQTPGRHGQPCVLPRPYPTNQRDCRPNA